MESNKDQDLTRDYAIWLMGFNDAMLAMYALRDMDVVSAMKRIQTKEHVKSMLTVSKIMNGGAFNPVDLLEMNRYVESLETWIKKEAEKI